MVKTWQAQERISQKTKKNGARTRRQLNTAAANVNHLSITSPERATSARGISSSAETPNNLFICWKATGRLLREREPTVNSNLEDAATGPTQTYLRRRFQFQDQFPRRTGTRFIASLATVFDFDFHETDLANWIDLSHRTNERTEGIARASG